ncbi:hypothetical protein EVAR_66437_1 [Eumeta japonica]|uniref:Uncharacterized protein n=1 Tax=Eumeta variegata TaxID=151549 RepID=A0A4C1ZIW1_EUMVA|nr:hypothetical protein EVAR_66437_1 [Eumeta japonica]
MRSNAENIESYAWPWSQEYDKYLTLRLMTRLCGIAIRECPLKYKARNYAPVKLVTKASQWRKIETRHRRRNGRGAYYLLSISFAANSERQSFMHCILWGPGGAAVGMSTDRQRGSSANQKQ